MQYLAANKTGSFTSMNDNLVGGSGGELSFLFHFFSLISFVGKLSWNKELCFILKKPLDMGNGEEPAFLGHFSKVCFNWFCSW